MERSFAFNLLRERSRPVFATLDAARGNGLHAELLAEGSAIQSLYSGNSGDELEEVAPYLLAIGDQPALLERLVTEGWGRAWSIYATCDRPFDEVRKHFRKFLKVKTADGEELYFRFYDPRVLRIFLPTCNTDQLKEFFGPITAFWSEGEDPNICIEFRLGKAGLETERINLENVGAVR